MLSRFVLACLTLVVLPGCVRSRNVRVDITTLPTGAKVDVNGAFVGEAPTTANVSCKDEWVGLLNSNTGWRPRGESARFEARRGQQRAVKDVDVCAGDYARVNLELAGQSLEVPVRSEPTDAQAATLRKLEELHDNGVLNDDEYAAKVKQVLGGDGAL